MSRAPRLRIDSCPQCGFKFRGRPESHEHLSPLGRRLQLAGYWAFLPVMLGIAAFIALTRDERGLMLEFTGRANLIAFAIFGPSMLLFVLSMLVPKRCTYRCPQCSWERTLRPNDRVDPAAPVSDKPAKPTDDPAP